MERRFSAGLAVSIMIAFGVLQVVVMNWFMTPREIKAPVSVPPKATVAPVTPRGIQLPDVRVLLKDKQYNLIRIEKIKELGSEIEPYIPQMIEELREFEFIFQTVNSPRAPDSYPVLIAAGEYALPPLIEMLDEKSQRGKAMGVLAAMGSEALPALPKLSELLRVNCDLNKVKQSSIVNQLERTMEKISPGSAATDIAAVWKVKSAWQPDITARLADSNTHSAAFVEAANMLRSEGLTLLAAAEKALTETSFSKQGYAVLLEIAEDFPNGIFLKLDHKGSIDSEYIKGRVTPQFMALLHVLDVHMQAGQPQLNELLDEPGHPLWRIAAQAEVLYGNPEEHLEDFIEGKLHLSLMPSKDLTFDFISEHRDLATPLLIERLEKTYPSELGGRSKVAQIIQFIYGLNRSAFQAPNQEPIAGLDELTPKLLSASRRAVEVMRESFFMMRFLENPSPEVIERLTQQIEMYPSCGLTQEARMAFETLYSMAYNDPAIIEFALVQTNHGHKENRLWAAKILWLKGVDDPRTIPALTRLLTDTDGGVAAEAQAGLAQLGKQTSE